MKTALRNLLFAAFLLLPGVAFAQCSFPTPVPANVVIGRLGVGPGPCQAIPFATLSSKLTGAIITLNSGNGQTAPGGMSGGNTYSFGATTDTPQFTGAGFGGAAPATGLEIYNAAVSPTLNGQGVLGATAVNGGVLAGQGSTYDAMVGNKNLAVALGVPTGTQSLVMPNPATVGTVAGSLCATSGGLILYEVAVNCFTVSGISVTSGKTLTVTNTITLSGTDGTTMTLPGASATLAGLATNQTFSGTDTFSSTFNCTGTCQLAGAAFGTFATQNFATPPAIGGTTPAAGAFSTLTATTPVGLSSGGTNASTAAAARASAALNVDELTPHGDSNYQMLATDRTVGTSTALTSPRTWTLPAASSVNSGQNLIVQDFKGAVSGTNTLTVQRAGSDTLNGSSTSITINTSGGGYLFISDGVSNWSAQALGAQASAGVSSVNGQTGSVGIIAGTSVSVSTTGGNVTINSPTLLSGVILAKTGAYPAVTGDCGSTITLGGSAQYTLTLNAASGYASNCGFLITNLASETSSKTLAINGLTVRNIYPGESLIVSNQSNAWAIAPQLGRYKASAAIPLFIRPDGSDTVCDGLTNAAASGASGQACAFLTANACMNSIAQNIDINSRTDVGCRHTCASPPCTFTNNAQFLSMTGGVSFVGGAPYYKGDTTTPTNAKFNPSGPTTADIQITLEPTAVPIQIGGFEFAGGGNVSYGLYCGGGSSCNMAFAWQCDAMSATASTGFPAGACMEANSTGHIYLNANYTVTGSVGSVLSYTNGGYIEVGSAITSTGAASLTFANGYAYGQFGGSAALGSITFSSYSSITGAGCNIGRGASLNINGGAASYFPNGGVTCSVGGGGVSDSAGNRGQIF